MKYLADIAAFDANKNLVLIVQIKNKVGTNTDWAAKTRRNLITYGNLPEAPFFLLALPDRFYLWKNEFLPDEIPPTYEVDPSPFLKSYFERTNTQPDKITPHGIELLLLSWLQSLVFFQQTQGLSESADKWLFESGLFTAMQGGTVETDVEL